MFEMKNNVSMTGGMVLYRPGDAVVDDHNSKSGHVILEYRSGACIET